MWSQWTETKKAFCKEILRWISPLEAFTDQKQLERENIITYKDMLNEQNKMKTWEEKAKMEDRMLVKISANLKIHYRLERGNAEREDETG